MSEWADSFVQDQIDVGPEFRGKTVKCQKMRELGHLMVSSEDLSYNDEGKERYRKVGLAAFRQLAKLLELKEYDVHFNPGGIAVSGDLTLIGLWSDGNGVYVSMNKDFPNQPWGQILYRTVKHMKDWTGGVNQWLHFDMLFEPYKMKKVIMRLKK